jgi:dolichol-phosphate mannosyltransferase
MISIVIPTYRESESVQQTLRRAAAALWKYGDEFELIVVDDESDDGTAEKAESLQNELPVRVLRRKGKRGLATAVVDGWATARGDILGVMDGDLQHPPEVLAELADAMQRTQADLVVASRYCRGGGSLRWPWWRRVASAAATHLAATVLPLRLSGMTDPMSGMFLVRARAIEGAELTPIGFRILLEVVGKGKIGKLCEVPYLFEKREQGRSKLGARECAEYLMHLARLAWSTGQLRKWMRYTLVGLTGAVVNLSALDVMAVKAGWPLAAAAAAAIELAIVYNFFGNWLFTFSRCPAGPFARRLARYELICAPGAALNWLLTLSLFGVGFPLLGAAAVGIAADGLVNLTLNIPSIWKIWGPDLH